jgi:hypothetical protein
MSRFVFDEWVWADLNGENGENAQKETYRLLQCIFEKCDQLVTVRGSKFVTKFYRMAREARTGCKREIVRVLKAQFFQNANKLDYLDETSLGNLPTDVVQRIKDDDHYLIRAYLSSNVDGIITTDTPLIDVLADCSVNVTCWHRDSFMAMYLS